MDPRATSSSSFGSTRRSRPARAARPSIARILDSGFFAFRRTFDPRLGGFGGAPKFPRPSVYNFLLRYYARTKNQEALDMALLTLREMAKGGMHDQLGGGFHRYSVDERWFVPHFEKMLYDQAQLAISYLEAFQITGDPQYAATARRIFDYVLRDMTGTEGGFYSAEDADSAIDPARPDVKGEGAFYIWSAGRDSGLLSRPARRRLVLLPLRRRGGRQRGRRPARRIHRQEHPLPGRTRWRRRRGNSAGRWTRSARACDQAGRILLEARSKRVRPHLDDKVLTAWNGLMISAFALGGAVLDEPRYAAAARRAAEFLIARMYDPQTGALLRRYRQGEAAIPAFWTTTRSSPRGCSISTKPSSTCGIWNWPSASPKNRWSCSRTATRARSSASAADDASLVMRVKEDYDGAEPSGNSVAADESAAAGAVHQPLRLPRIGREDAGRLRLAPGGGAGRAAADAGGLRVAAGRAARDHPGGRAGATPIREALLRTLYSRFVPNRVVLLVDSAETRRALAAGIPGD